MIFLKKITYKTWIFAIAAILIIGSSTIMTYALNSNIPKDISDKEKNVKSLQSNLLINSNTEEKYILVDRTQMSEEEKNNLIKKLENEHGMTEEKVQKELNKIIAIQTPNDKDISAQKAAAYAAKILKKTYPTVDLNGYTAEAFFRKNIIPNSDSWTIAFKSPDVVMDNNETAQEMLHEKYYTVDINSVNGVMQNIYFVDRNTSKSTNLSSPLWVETAKKYISVFLPENVSILNSKIVNKSPEVGVIIVCDLSDGSAYGIRLADKDKIPQSIVVFTNGYDGSLDAKTINSSTGGIG